MSAALWNLAALSFASISDGCAEFRRHLRIERPRVGGVSCFACAQRERRVPLENGTLPRRHLVEDYAERVEIRRGSILLHRPARRHVLRCAMSTPRSVIPVARPTGPFRNPGISRLPFSSTHDVAAASGRCERHRARWASARPSQSWRPMPDDLSRAERAELLDEALHILGPPRVHRQVVHAGSCEIEESTDIGRCVMLLESGISRENRSSTSWSAANSGRSALSAIVFCPLVSVTLRRGPCRRAPVPRPPGSGRRRTIP